MIMPQKKKLLKIYWTCGIHGCGEHHETEHEAQLCIHKSFAINALQQVLDDVVSGRTRVESFERNHDISATWLRPGVIQEGMNGTYELIIKCRSLGGERDE